MKKIFIILNVAIMALFALGCENQNGGGDGITFKFGEASVTSSAIEVSVTPSDSNINYFADIFATDDIQGKDDTTIIDECLNSEKFRSRKGTQIVAAKNLTPETSYTVVVFALTETKVTRKVYTTTETVAPLSPEEFNINIEVKDITATSATAIATPNGSNRYYFRVITKMELDAFGIYNDDYQIFEYIIENPNSGEWITEGKTTLNCRLSAETDYLAVAFNFENWEAMHNKEDEIKLFRYEFKTPEGAPVDPDSLFVTSDLITNHTNFNLTVTPANAEAHWTYYIWTKESYDETLANEAKANIVMRSYFGLNNIAVEQGYGFGDIIQEDKLGRVGTHTISSYQTLKNNTDYVVVLFYVDPTTVDPTSVYDYNYVAVPFKTAEPSTDTIAKLEVSEAVIVKSGFSYDVQFLVKTDEYATDLLVGAQLWANFNFEKYWDPNDWSQIQAFFMFRKSVGAETLAVAKTSEGATISFTGFDKNDYVFFFEVLNEENTPTQYAVRVTAEMFDNAQ
ncbi:MAG: hypothetical protein IKZ32_00285 [Alistipes sp.]|nr:hypothetical protein [Alistipes sp.]